MFIQKKRYRENCAPIFSVIIPTFSRRNLLPRAIESVINQTYSVSEIIVVDDGTPEGVGDISIFRNDKVNLLRTEKNRGAAYARNLGVAVATGSHISFLDDDDEMAPTILEKTAEVFLANPQLSFSWCATEWVSQSSQLASNIELRRSKRDHSVFANVLRDCLSIGIGCGVTMPRLDFLKLGGFDSKMKYTEDTDLILRVLIETRAAKYIDEPLMKIHNHCGVRLTNMQYHPYRIQEVGLLMKKFSRYFEEFPFLQKALGLQIKFLQASLDSAG